MGENPPLYSRPCAVVPTFVPEDPGYSEAPIAFKAEISSAILDGLCASSRCGRRAVGKDWCENHLILAEGQARSVAASSVLQKVEALEIR